MHSDSTALQEMTTADLRPISDISEQGLHRQSKSTNHDRHTGLRVLIVAFQGGKQADGGVESLTQLIERYDALRLTILSQTETAKNARWRTAGCRVLVWPLGYRPGRTGGYVFTLLRIFRALVWNLRIAWLVLNRSIDLVHINDPHALWHVIFGLRLVGTPTVYNIRDTKPLFSKRDLVKWRCSFWLTDAQIVLSREMRAFWKKALRVSGKHLSAIYSIVDFQTMFPPFGDTKKTLRTELGLPDTFVAGYVASFSEKKSQLNFIMKAGPELRRIMPRAKVYFVGDFKPELDPYAAECLQATKALGLQNQLIFKGYTSGVANWYKALDAVIVATRNEGLARCMIESLACGTPVISFDVCSAREVLEGGTCGAIVAQGDYRRLIGILAEWSDGKAKRLELGRQGAEWAKARFTGHSAVEGYTQVYLNAVGETAGV